MNVHICTLGKTIGHVLSSFTHYKIDRLVIISSPECKDSVEDLKHKIEVFGIDVDLYAIDPFCKDSYYQIVDFIVDYYLKFPKEQFYINITGGTNLMSSAALTSAHFIGANTYYVLKDNRRDNIIEVPLLKFSINDALTEKQKIILRILHKEIYKKGEISNISEFASKEGTYKQRLMHYIYELEKLNIINVDRSKREYKIKFTPTGALLYKLIVNK